MQSSEIKSPRGTAVFLLLFGALVMAAGLPLRIWQQFHLVESQTGFWLPGASRATIILLYVILGVLIVVPFVAGVMQRKQLTLDIARRSRMAEGCAAIVAAVTIVVGVALALHFAISVFSGQATIEGLTPQSNNRVQFFIRSGAAAALLEAVFGLGAAIFFANLAFVNLFPSKQVYLNRLLAITPVLWVIARVLRRFSRTIAYLRISDLFLTLVALVLLMIFLLAFAQILAGVNNSGKEWRLAAAGIPAAVLLLLGFIPRVAAYWFGSNLIAPQDAAMELADPALAIFICIFLYERLLKLDKLDTPEELDEPEEPEQLQAGEA